MKTLKTSATRMGAIMAAVVLFSTGAAFAKSDAKPETYKLYAKAGGGYNATQPQDYTVENAEFHDGYAIEAAVGYKLKYWRVEGELSYRQNNVDQLQGSGGTFSTRPSGDVAATTLMLNGYYDLSTQTGIKPYIGAGIGMSHVSANEYQDGLIVIADHADDVFAYQGIIGSNFNISDTFALFAEYKYFATDDFEVDTAGHKGNYQNHSVLFGMKYNFN